MIDEIDAVLAMTEGLSAEQIVDDYRNRRAVERAIQIISEAAKELPPEVRAEEPDMPWASIIGIGNMLRHEYYRIKVEHVQDIVLSHLPQLRPAVARLLARHGA
ncbi:MAG: HepT-like ribonuclease domain-containing protein [Xanthobacteraceae bacterium]